MKYDYIYIWRNNPERAKHYGMLCRIITIGKKRTVLIEMENGERITTSILALRKFPVKIKHII